MGITNRVIPSVVELSPLQYPKGSLPSQHAVLQDASQKDMLGLLSQLAHLFQHSNAIFGELVNEVSITAKRISSLGARVDSLLGTLPHLEQHVSQVQVHEAGNTPMSGRATRFTEDAQLFLPEHRPAAIASLVAASQPPPDLPSLDQFAEDGSSCLKKYTNSQFFFEMWFQEQEARYNQAKQKRDAKRERSRADTKNVEKKVVRRVTLRREKINTLGAEFSENASAAATPAGSAKIAISSISSDSSKKADKAAKSKEKKEKSSKEKPPKDDKIKKEKSKEKPPKDEGSSSSGGGRLRGLTKMMRSSAAPGTIEPLKSPGGPLASSGGGAANFPPPPSNLPPPTVGGGGGGSGPAPSSGGPPPPSAPPPPPPPPMPSMKAPRAKVQKENDGADANSNEEHEAGEKKPVVQQTSLFDAIQKGVTLRKAERVDEAPPVDAAKATIAQILARRVAMEDSDSDQEEDDFWE